MLIRKLAASVALLLLPAPMWADVSFDSTTQMTGGTLVDMLKNSPFVIPSMKAMLAPTTEITIVQGNRKAVIGKDHTEIYDLDKETITRIDNDKKTYTVQSFAQMREMLKEMPQKMAEAQAKMQQAQAKDASQPNYTVMSDTQVKNPGVTKVVNGLNAEERIVTLTTKVTITNPPPNTPPGSPTSFTYILTTDLWIAPEPPEMKEARDFDMRMWTKIAQGLDTQAFMDQMKSMKNTAAGLSMMFADKPGATDAMAQMDKEIVKMNGIRVLEVTSMTTPDMPAAAAGSAAAPPPSGSNVAGQVATDTATQTASGESSKMGIFGNALASSALGAFKKKQSQPAAKPAAAATPAPAGPVVLMSMTTQKANFSHEAAPASAFQIPAGYKLVQSPNGF